MRAKINIDTLTKVRAFADICSKLGGKIKLTDGQDYCVNARSLLGIVATADWSEVYIDSEEDIYQYIQEFVVLE